MPERHHLIWLSDAGWQRLLGVTDEPHQRQAIAQWQQQRWPAVLRRADVDLPAGEISAGIALPPDAHGNKPRIALRVRADEVLRRQPPLLLRDIDSEHLPQAWRDPALALLQAMSRAGIELAVYGSLAWQAITGQTYLRASSDIDIQFQPASRDQLEQGVRLLAYHAMFLPLDGEVVFPQGEAVSWKEWRQVAVLGADAQGRVLAKTASAVRLARVGTLRDALPPGSSS